MQSGSSFCSERMDALDNIGPTVCCPLLPNDPDQNESGAGRWPFGLRLRMTELKDWPKLFDNFIQF